MRTKASFFRKVAITLTVVTLVVTSAKAAALLPGNTIGLSLEANPTIGSSVVASFTSFFVGTDISGTTNFTGNLASTVWSGDVSNPYGGLTFTYQLNNDSFSLDALERLTLSKFDGFLTDVSYFGAGALPLNVERGLANSGRQIAFNFSTPNRLQPGAGSALLVIQTSATFWQGGNASIIDDATANAFTYVPATAVPEPTVLSLALIGVVGLAVRRNQSKK